MNAQQKRERAQRAAAALDMLGGDSDVAASGARDGGVEVPTKGPHEHPAGGTRAVNGPVPSKAPEPIDPKHHPHKWKEGELKAGDSVFYRGERWWVAFVHSRWSDGCYARICNRAVRPSNPLLPDGCTSFFVHADQLSPAPVAKNPFADQPTAAAVDRKARARKGERDVGDEVATLLREAKDIYACAAKFLGVTAGELKAKYGHMDAGRQRMNLGNRMRFKFRKEQGA